MRIIFVGSILVSPHFGKLPYWDVDLRYYSDREPNGKLNDELCEHQTLNPRLQTRKTVYRDDYMKARRI